MYLVLQHHHFFPFSFLHSKYDIPGNRLERTGPGRMWMVQCSHFNGTHLMVVDGSSSRVRKYTV